MTGSPPFDSADGPLGQDLWSRADQVLPGGGLYLTRSADMAGRGVLPGFITAASGCRVTDADGREYVDWLCANGPNLLGYLHPEVEEAVARQQARMTTASLFPAALVEVVERLVARYPPMAWGMVAKNGSEVVALAVRTARQLTQRRRICAFARAYHGNDPELASAPRPGVLSAGTEQIDRLPWNDPQALLDHLERHGDATAAILINPLDQSPLTPTSAADADFVAAMEQARDRFGVLLIVDSVRHGFRLHPDGCHHAMGLTPDLLVLGKALGNGHSISALLGAAHTRAGVRRIMFTSTYMFESPPMHAAMAVLEIYDRDQVFAHISAVGERLAEGMKAAARAAEQDLVWSGPPTMPSMFFARDRGDLVRGRRFCSEMAKAGIIWHPLLNHFVSAAHDADAVDSTLAAAREAFAAVALAEEKTDDATGD